MGDTVTQPNPSSLLRLFQSEMFDRWLAVTYLFKYTDAGVQHYLCQLLREQPPHEVEYYLPQLCHLTVIRPQSSVALQEFLIWLCHRSTHAAVLLYWYVNAYTSDYAADSENPSYHVCLKLAMTCRNIVFSGRPSDAPSPDPSRSFDNADERGFSSAANSAPPTRTPSPHVLGFSARRQARAVAAGLPSSASHPMLVGLGRENERPARSRRNSVVGNDGDSTPRGHRSRGNSLSAADVSPSVSSDFRPSMSHDSTLGPLAGGAFAPRRLQPNNVPVVGMGLGLIMAAVACPDLVLPFRDLVLTYATNEEPEPNEMVEQLEDAPPEQLPTPLATFKVPSMEEMRTGRGFSFQRFLSANLLPTSQTRKSKRAHHQFSIPHYFHSEITFVLTLEDIGQRLVSVPPDTRQGTLEAELALLNHNLPARVCAPLWCTAHDDDIFAHHVIVRVLPQESAILNSRTRVPYLMYLEVLEADGNVDPYDTLHLTAGDSEFRAPAAPTPRVSVDTSTLAPPLPRTPRTPRMKRSQSHDMNANPAESQIDEQMRTASVLLSQLSAHDRHDGSSSVTLEIRSKIISQMKSLVTERKLKRRAPHGDSLTDMKNVADDPSAIIFQEDYDLKMERIRASSPYGKDPRWRLLSVIVKTGDDLRQEQLGCQLISEFRNIWEASGLTDIFVRPFRVMVTSQSSGLMETVTDAVSIHSMRRHAYANGLLTEGAEYTLLQHFIHDFGEPTSEAFQRAQTAFVGSLVGYSLVTYMLSLKDRHNSNILVDRSGHLVHIDFGFMLTSSPGRVGFETAPFKLTQEYVDVMGGVDSPVYASFRDLFLKGFLSLRKHAESLAVLIELMEERSSLPCFSGNRGKAADTTARQFQERFQQSLTDQQCAALVDGLIASSLNNVYTTLYDQYQYYTNGIL